MDITITDKGFVQTEALTPVGYAGERNSRKLFIIHPHFKDCYYQLLVKRFDELYTLGVTDGVCEIPASLLRSAVTLNCQFVALSTPCSVQNDETDTFVMKSDAFTLQVAEGLNVGNLSPIPTYEELQKMYCNIHNAQAAVDKAKKDNEEILKAIQDALKAAQDKPYDDVEQAWKDAYKEKLDEIANEHFEEFADELMTELIKRLHEMSDIGEIGEVGKMSKEELEATIKKIHNQLIEEAKSGTATWSRVYNRIGAYTMSQDGKIIGGR